MISEITKPIPGKEPTKIFAFGGLEEIGKNMYGIEYKDELIIIDCGIKFANNELLGIDGIVANFSYLRENAHKLKAVFITHGHEDHIGGVPYLLKEFDVPVIYAPKIASEFILRKLQEHKDAKPTKIEVYNDDTVVKTEYFTVDFYRVNHSIPDAFGICVQTPNGNIVESGDYRFDFEAKGDELNMHKVVEIAKRGVALFMSETTNSEIPGFSPSEQKIYSNINKIIKEAQGRVIMTTFASNTTRINEVVELALNLGRKVCLLGKSMEANVATSRKVGYINIKDSDLIAARDLKKHPDETIMIFCTGSQGEELAALNVMSRGKHPWVSLKPEDTIIMSSNPIPGNYANVEYLINELSKHGVTIFENSPSNRLHASGHATKQELQLMLRLLGPKYLLPIHGEFKMFRSVQKLAEEIGFDKDNVVIVKNGDILHLVEGELFYTDQSFFADPVYIEGRKTSKSSAQILKERRILSEDGVFTVILAIDKLKHEVLGLPIIVTRGCFFAKESGPLITKMSHAIKQSVNEELRNQTDFSNGVHEEAICKATRNVANYYIWRNKKRNPLINTLIQEI
ncbi:ribonuclease J [[Mycoplasma] testudinis]|uniref:ribonuclease J n=1 Tax=[Mycoplasma] testudinis TaxID=33924 RepID=UPI0004886FFA|nr:ribonuclease J [[Mycoplasma] testudinis]